MSNGFDRTDDISGFLKLAKKQHNKENNVDSFELTANKLGGTLPR
jgi:hypothetical protein